MHVFDDSIRPCHSSRHEGPLIASTVRKLAAIALLLLALAHVVLGVVYLTEDLMSWGAVSLPVADAGSGAPAEIGAIPGGPAAYAVFLLLGAPLLLGGGLVLFREGGALPG